MNDTVYRQAAINAIISYFGLNIEEEYGGAVQEVINGLPSAESERKAPVSYKEQLSLDCSFCRQHERGDTLYESSDWDGGIGFDYIRDIQFCPICGRDLYSDE